nr:MAG TPA: hypothetical protein [Caudoviricetes sp.]
MKIKKRLFSRVSVRKFTSIIIFNGEKQDIIHVILHGTL